MLVLSMTLQFFNKVLYAREGAKGIMDKTFVDFPWQIRLEVDGVDIEVPEVSLRGMILFFQVQFLGKSIIDIPQLYSDRKFSSYNSFLLLSLGWSQCSKMRFHYANGFGAHNV